MQKDEWTERGRFFLKDTIRDHVDFGRTDQACRVPPPPMEKKPAPGARLVDLVPAGRFLKIGRLPLIDAIRQRESRRTFADTPLSLEELSFLAWATQGLRNPLAETPMFRTVPSAGARHALETYLHIRRVEGLDEGIYHYLPIEHQLEFAFAEPHLADQMTRACRGQSFVAQAAAVFVWVAIPYRMEWRYGAAAHKVLAMDAGHACQNLYLACEAIRAGTCAIAAYDQQAMDQLLRVDGDEEFTVYVAPVGKKKTGRA